MIFFVGVIPERFPEIELISLSPIGGSLLWDGLFSYCPILSFLRYSFNPITVNGGSTDMQYVNKIEFTICVLLEHLNYLHLKASNIFAESLKNICYWDVEKGVTHNFSE